MKPLFIVVEGLDATGKTTLTKSLAAQYQAEPLKCPPQLTAELLGDNVRAHFDGREPTVRRAYYRAANLLASEQALRMIKEHGKAVVMDRYWPSTVAFSHDEGLLDQWMDGSYPPELLVPDLLILLTVDEEARVRRLAGRGAPATLEEESIAAQQAYRDGILTAYRRFEVVEIDTSELTADEVLQAALDIVQAKIRVTRWQRATDCWCNHPFTELKPQLCLKPAEPGENQEQCEWPSVLHGKILYGLTAFNPLDCPTPHNINQAASTELEAQIKALQQAFPLAVQWWHGFSEGGEEREPGFMVMLDAEVLTQQFITRTMQGLAQQFSQAALFEYKLEHESVPPALIRRLVPGVMPSSLANVAQRMTIMSVQ